MITDGKTKIVKKIKQFFLKNKNIVRKPTYKEIDELTDVSVQGRFAYAIMCAEKYLLKTYPEKKWEIIFRDIWKITDARYWDDWLGYMIECIPEFLEEFESYESSDFEYLSKEKYIELKRLYENTGKDVSTILKMVWDIVDFYFNTMIEDYGNDNGLKGLEDILDFLKSSEVSFPDVLELKKYIITKSDGLGEDFEGITLSKTVDETIKEEFGG